MRLDSELLAIARRIRRWREAKALTLQELAARSGLATSTVQKIETGQMVPSVAVLLKLAHGLGRRAAELVQDAEGAPDVMTLRAHDRHPVGVRRKLLVERISGDLADPSIDAWRVTLWPGYSSGEDDLRFEGEVLLLCEEGTVTVRVDGRDHVLAAGDALQFKSRLPHSWRNPGDVPTRFTLTATLSRDLRAAMQGRLRGARLRRSA